MAKQLIDAVARATRLVAAADAVVVTAGAGMGVDSGLPDFRGDEGFWNAYPPYRDLGLSFVDLANPRWFVDDPTLAWGFYGHRLALYRATRPHAGFDMLRALFSAKPKGGFVFTSNVDGQFQRAGFDAGRIVECHGAIDHLQCTRAGCGDIDPADPFVPVVDERTFRLVGAPPTCSHCQRVARPNVLMFGDFGWDDRRTSAQEERFATWLADLGAASLVVIELGAGTAIPTVRMLGERLARRPATSLVRINPREPDAPAGQIGIAGGAAATLASVLGDAAGDSSSRPVS